MTENFTADPLSPLERRTYKPMAAEVLRRLLAAQEAGQIEDPWLPFPQRGCTFSFGPNRDIPLPIGALFLLWSAGPPFVQDCPDCRGQLYMISCGGLLVVGGGSLVCTGCGFDFYQSLGGLGQVSKILDESPIAGTPFRHTGMCFGGAYASDGAQLGALLGVEFALDDETADDEISVSIKRTGEKLRLHMDIRA